MFYFIIEETLIAVICDCIVILGLVGCGGCIIRAINNIQKEQETLKKCESFVRRLEKNKITDDGYKDFVKLINKEEITSQAIQKKIHEDSPLRTSYVSERFMNILSAVSDKNHVRKAPTISDLHELTLQREQGGKCVGVFRAITPSILVLGIFGTLVGVHVKLSVDKFDLANLAVLAEALLPGILAVLTTIITIFFRGWYNKNWSEFITELDELTVTKILPFFQQPEIISLDIERFTDTIHEVLEGENRLDFGKVAEQLQELNGLIGEWQKVFKKLGEPLLTENLPTTETGFRLLEKFRKDIGMMHEYLSNNVRRLQQLCTAYSQNAAAEVEVTNALLENLPEECTRLIEQLQRDTLHINSISNTLAQQEEMVRNAGFEEKAQEIQAGGKNCAELLEWIAQLPEHIQQHYGDAYDNFVANFQNLQKNKAYIEKGISVFATLPAACETRRVSLSSHFSHGLETLQKGTQPLLRTLNGETEQTRYYQQKMFEMKGLYPPGLFGWKMRLFDLVGNLRYFFYKRWMGRILLLGLLIYFILFL